MHSGFTRGLIIGGLIGASVSLALGPEMVSNSSRRRMMRTGRHFLKKSGSIMGDMIELLT